MHIPIRRFKSDPCWLAQAKLYKYLLWKQDLVITHSLVWVYCPLHKLWQIYIYVSLEHVACYHNALLLFDAIYIFVLECELIAFLLGARIVCLKQKDGLRYERVDSVICASIGLAFVGRLTCSVYQKLIIFIALYGCKSARAKKLWHF